MAPLVLIQQGLYTPANSAPQVSGGSPTPEIVTLLQEGFDDNNAGLTARGWYDGGSATISSTETHGGAGSLQATISSSGTGPTWTIKRHLFTPTATLYLSYWVKYSTNWVGSGVNYHPHEWLILSDQDGDFAPLASNVLNCYVEHNYNAGGYPQIQMQDNLRINYANGALPNDLTATNEDRSTCGCNGVDESPAPSFIDCYDTGGGSYYSAKVFRGGTVAFSNNSGDTHYKNNWNHVEVYMAMNTVAGGVSTNDGILQYWRNGTLLIDRADMDYRTATHANLKWKQIALAPYIGDGSPATQTAFYDDLLVATGRPTPPEVPPGVSLSFIQAPVNTLEDTVIVPAITVGVRDNLGNIVTTATDLVTMSIGSGSGVLGGDTTKNAVAGIATFNDLQIDTPGPKSLLAVASGLASVSSPVFDIDEITGGPSGWPNEPAGGTLLNEWDFSDVIPTSGEVAVGSSGWTRIAFQPGTMFRTSDSAEPQSPPFCCEIGFPANFRSDGVEPGTLYRNIGGGNDIYWGFYWKPSNPFAQHSSNVHKIVFMFLGGGGAGGQFYIQMHGTGGTGFLRVTTELSSESTQNRDPNVNTTNVTLGVWHRVEMRFRKSPSLLQWWLDGILQGNYTNVAWPGNAFGEAKFAPTWGGSGGPTASVASYYRFGHTRMKRIS